MDYIKNSYSKTYGISISNPKFAKIYTSHTDIWANVQIYTMSTFSWISVKNQYIRVDKETSFSGGKNNGPQQNFNTTHFNLAFLKEKKNYKRIDITLKMLSESLSGHHFCPLSENVHIRNF